MTWTINLTGHDDLAGDQKVAYEEGIVEKVRALAAALGETDGGRVTSATVTTNTTGTVNLLEPSE